MNMINIAIGFLYIIFAWLAGALIVGLDRIITARMQGRVGPPILQPIYDVFKLHEKEKVVVTKSQNFFILCYVLSMIFTGWLFFSGGDILLVIFALTLTHIFLILGAYATNSPYAFIGAERELIQVMAFEPMILLVAAGMYIVSGITIPGGSFYVSDLATLTTPIIYYMPLLFIGLLFVLTIKLRKSPFDLSTSHHAHQEIVKGITTEFSGSSLGRIEIAHWYETVLILGFVYLFFASNPILAVIVTAFVYLLEIFIDNSYPRVKWGLALNSSWLIAAVLGLANIIILWYYFMRGGV
jgi:ech hydrogenase subunit B